MIRLNRVRTTAAVPASLRGDKRRAREAELLALKRNHLLSKLKDILAQLEAQGVTGAARDLTIDAIRAMMEARQPYAGMVQYFVRVAWSLGI